MELVSFSVTNYRSITNAHKISLGNVTVLVGKNNEGKSNILNALNVATTAIIMHSKYGEHTPPLIKYRKLYEWERDFPILFQGRTNGLESIFRLNFKLSDIEATEFRHSVGIRGNEEIPIEVRVGKDNKFKIYVPKRGSSSYNSKSQQVTRFISRRISFNYIQAVRTGQMTLDAIQQIIRDELSILESDPEYCNAIKVIDGLQKKVLHNISAKIKLPLQEFLPKIKSVNIKSSELREDMRFDSKFDIIIDDGTPTSIDMKGDGIKSLAALAILKDRKNTKAASIIAIEEPESHLHPAAMHRIVDVINGLSNENQIIITTHNPLFVERNSISSNIIVDKGKASPAKNIKEIRDVLGVMPADNLIDASYILVVEGDDDRISLTKILSALSKNIKEALKSNVLVIKAIGGAGNLCGELNTLKGFMCKFFVYVDNDEAGKLAVNKAQEKGLLKDSEVKYTICNGQSESEFEDCLKSDFYKDIIKFNFSVDICVSEFRGNKKWSDRMKNVFLSQGAKWTDSVEEKVKYIVANAIPENIQDVLNEHKRNSIDALVSIIEDMIK